MEGKSDNALCNTNHITPNNTSPVPTNSNDEQQLSFGIHIESSFQPRLTLQLNELPFLMQNKQRELGKRQVVK